VVRRTIRSRSGHRTTVPVTYHGPVTVPVTRLGFGLCLPAGHSSRHRQHAECHKNPTGSNACVFITFFAIFVALCVLSVGLLNGRRPRAQPSRRTVRVTGARGYGDRTVGTVTGP